MKEFAIALKAYRNLRVETTRTLQLVSSQGTFLLAALSLRTVCLRTPVFILAGSTMVIAAAGSVWKTWNFSQRGGRPQRLNFR